MMCYTSIGDSSTIGAIIDGRGGSSGISVSIDHDISIGNRLAGGLKKRFVVLVLTVVLISMPPACLGFEVYFPMSSVRLNLPINEKSQSIFSKIPIGRFQVLSALNNTLAPNYIYSLEHNVLLRINGSTGEVFIRNDYQTINETLTLTLTALPKDMTSSGHSSSLSSPPLERISHMTLSLRPMLEEEFCQNLENICFWSAAHYTVVEDVTIPIVNGNNGPQQQHHLGGFQHIEVGTLNPRGMKYICERVELRYILERGAEYFALKDNTIYTKMALDHESLNISSTGHLNASVRCVVKTRKSLEIEFKRNLNITIIDRNDNRPELQMTNYTYNFTLNDPHFQANETIGEKILFIDKDTLARNSHLEYIIHNDTHGRIRAQCNAIETDHTGKRNTWISCQITFSRNGLQSEPEYCFQLEAIDHAVEWTLMKSAIANICLHTDPEKIHIAERPQTMALQSWLPVQEERTHRKSSRIVNSDESFGADGEGGVSSGIAFSNSIINPYTKDVYVHRQAARFSRVTQPRMFSDLLNKSELRTVRFALMEDRSGAFAITSAVGIIYVKDVTALQQSPETVYFLNVSWHDTYKHSYVINVHLFDDEASLTNRSSMCEFKVKSRSQTCAQVKYAQQCVKFCGLATNGSSACEWRGTNDAIYSRNYGTCVPNALYCPDNKCDPLEEQSKFICPQDCIPGSQVIGPRSINDNKLGIYTASGTCVCGDNEKCTCAPQDDYEPRPKRKRKNETRTAPAKPFIYGENEANSQRIDTMHNDEQKKETAAASSDFVCGKSCLMLSIVCPLVVVVLIVCLLLARRSIRSRRLGKESLKAQKSDAHSSIASAAGGDDAAFGMDSSSKECLALTSLKCSKFNVSGTKWEFNRNDLLLDVVLGEGEFGKVMRGYATNIADCAGVTTVAVKMLKSGANSVEYMALLSEFQLLQEVSHPNVIKLLGACTDGEGGGESPMIIIEYARYGSLRSYLRLSRKLECPDVDFGDGGAAVAVNVRDVLSFAWQICKGMAYLTEMKLVHRDLAARNVLLADGKICKISDFGLTRDVYEDDAYLKRSRDRVPVKWMAPESLADHVYTTKSDVWAFGVLCWELITLGASPYPGVPVQNLYHLLKTGYRMERPENCSEEVYTIVRSCWTDEPNGRPSFKYLALQFEMLLGNNAKYIELETNAISNPNYCSDETTKLVHSVSQTKLNQLSSNASEWDPLDHLWQQPKKTDCDSMDCPTSCTFSGTLGSGEFQPPPPGYDLPRPIFNVAAISNMDGQILHYENDLRFPLNIRKSIGGASTTSNSQNGSRCGGQQYAVPVKRGRSYVDMTNKSLIPDNLDINDFEKHLSKTISFRFSSLLNLKEHADDNDDVN